MAKDKRCGRSLIRDYTAAMSPFNKDSLCQGITTTVHWSSKMRLIAEKS